jgi:Ricin-type beta-trefoil lectin domain-like
MFIRRVILPALCFVSGCASVDPAPHRTSSDMATTELAHVDDLAPGDLSSSQSTDLAHATTPADLSASPPVTVPDLSPPADLGPFPPGTFYAISVKSDGQLLSIRNQSTLAGSITESQPAHGTPDQRWTLQLVDSGYRIINGQSGTCLDVASASTSDSAATGIYSCSSALSQEWKLQPISGTFYYNIINVNSSKCLDLDNAGTAAGTQIFQYGCKGGDNQQWFFTVVK